MDIDLWVRMDTHGYLWILMRVTSHGSMFFTSTISGAAVAPSAMFRHMIPRPTDRGSPLEPGGCRWGPRSIAKLVPITPITTQLTQVRRVVIPFPPILATLTTSMVPMVQAFSVGHVGKSLHPGSGGGRCWPAEPIDSWRHGRVWWLHSGAP